MFGTGKGCLIVFSTGLPFVYPLESTNHGDMLPGALLGAPLDCVLSLKRSGIATCVEGWVFLMPLPLDLLSHIT